MSRISTAEKAKRFLRSGFFIYSILIFITGVAVFLPFLQNRTSFIWEPDGTAQHFTAFVYYGEYIREIVQSIFAGHPAIPQFDLSIGLGSDILQALQYYTIGDPLNLLSALVPKEYAAYAYTLIMVLRYYLAGLAFMALAKYKKLPVLTSAAGAVIYVFTAYSMYMAIRHPSFLNPMIYFPLIILGAEMIFDKKRPYVFILSIFLAAVSCFYYFYVLSAFTVLYIFFRIFFVYGKQFFKGFLESLWKFGGAYILGVMMAAVIFFPLVSAFFAASRGQVEYGLSILFNKDFYKNFLSAFFNTQMIGNNTYFGFTALAAGGAVLLFAGRKKNGFLKLAFLVVTVMVMLPVFGMILNGFSYVVNRWSWVYGLLCAYTFAKCAGDLKTITVKKSVLLVAAAAVTTGIMAFLKTLNDSENLISCAVFFAFALLCLAYSVLPKIAKKVNKKTLGTVFKAGLCALAAAAVFINGFNFFSPSRSKYVSTFMTFKEAREYSNGERTAEIEKIQSESGGINRYVPLSIPLADCNESMISGGYSTNAYLSMIDGNIVEFQQDMGIINGNLSRINDTRWDPFLNVVLNTRYMVAKSTNSTFYGTENNSLGSVAYTDGGEYQIYENQYAVPFGCTYEKTLSQEEYDQLAPAEKRLAMLDCVVLNDSTDSGTATAADYQNRCSEISVSLAEAPGVVVRENRIYVAEDNTEVTLLPQDDLPDGGQFYFYAQNIRYSPLSTDDYEKAERGENVHGVRTDTMRKFFEPENSVGLSVSTDTRRESFSIYTPYNDYNTGVSDHMLNLGYYSSNPGELKMTFKKGVYELDSLRLIRVPMDSYNTLVAERAEETLQNVQTGCDSISGSITVSGSKWLYLSIPYSENWKAYVDGEEVEISRADSAFCAIPLESGEHSIELRYENRILLYSLPVSLAGAAVFAAVIIVTEKKIKKKKAN